MVRPPRLTDDELAAALQGPDRPSWELLGGRLVKVVECPSFRHALGYVVEVGELAEAMDHHPDVDLRYRTVTLALVTHDVGGLTSLDFDLARAVDGLDPGGRRIG
jgi:4a-hydroxytetrahydrobiopterin dehydratase